MAGSSLLALIDDIATLLDDISLLTKAASKKTAGVLGDDLALNAQQVTGIRAERELPVVWAVAKGSFRNKAILVPLALAISALAPWAITPLLMVGGAFLCYEGFEKVWHALRARENSDEAHTEHLRAVADSSVDLVAYEREKIRGAVRTDFILSAEIIAITLGIVATAAFVTQLSVLVTVAIAMTVGVYGLVAGIVKLDDAGLYLTQKPGDGRLAKIQRRIGSALLGAAPWLMKGLSVAGTVAMFLVGGGIVLHGLPGAHHFIDAAVQAVTGAPGLGAVLAALMPTLLNAVGGLITGAVVLLVVSASQRLLGREQPAEH